MLSFSDYPHLASWILVWALHAGHKIWDICTELLFSQLLCLLIVCFVQIPRLNEGTLQNQLHIVAICCGLFQSGLHLSLSLQISMNAYSTPVFVKSRQNVWTHRACFSASVPRDSNMTSTPKPAMVSNKPPKAEYRVNHFNVQTHDEGPHL